MYILGDLDRDGAYWQATATGCETTPLPFGGRAVWPSALKVLALQIVCCLP